MKKYWDHKTKPSTYIISFEGAVGFRGTYKDGMVYLKSLDNEGMISFEDDYLPAMREVTKVAYRALMCEQGLRREIIKLKKQLNEPK